MVTDAVTIRSVSTLPGCRGRQLARQPPGSPPANEPSTVCPPTADQHHHPPTSSAGQIYRGGSTSTSAASVSGMFSRQAQSGDQYCTGGSRSGEICGWTVNKVGVNIKYSDGATIRNAVSSKNKQGWCTRPGDSGGPVYIVSGSKVVAKGIISGGGGGGSDYYGGLFDQCTQVFTDIYQPYYGFPGVIRTG